LSGQAKNDTGGLPPQGGNERNDDFIPPNATEGRSPTTRFGLCETPSGAGELTRARDTTRVNAARRYVRSLRGKLPRSLPANAASAGCMCNARFELIGLLDAVSPLGKPLVRLLD
jgi:hypothetical protein